MNAKKQSGFTLVEIMVAVVVSLILLNGVIQIFSGTKETYRFGEAVSRMQESGRFAMDMLARDIRMAGYQGCADLSSIPPNVIANDPPVTVFNSEAIVGWEYTGSWAPTSPVQPSDIMTKVKTNTDVISIKHASSESMKLTGNMLVDNANIQVLANTIGVVAGEVLFISDCETADIFRTTSVSSGSSPVTMAHSNSQNTGNRLSKAYGTDASVFKFNDNVYFVGDTGRKNGRGQIIYSLFKRSINGSIDEIVEGVENMQILYGERADNGNMRYVPATNGTLDMSKVVSVRIAILVHSIEPVNRTADSNIYNVAGTNIGPSTTVAHDGDKRIRRVFVTTVKLRNRR